MALGETYGICLFALRSVALRASREKNGECGSLKDLGSSLPFDTRRRLWSQVELGELPIIASRQRRRCYPYSLPFLSNWVLMAIDLGRGTSNLVKSRHTYQGGDQGPPYSRALAYEVGWYLVASSISMSCTGLAPSRARLSALLFRESLPLRLCLRLTCKAVSLLGYCRGTSRCIVGWLPDAERAGQIGI